MIAFRLSNGSKVLIDPKLVGLAYTKDNVVYIQFNFGNFKIYKFSMSDSDEAEDILTEIKWKHG